MSGLLFSKHTWSFCIILGRCCVHESTEKGFNESFPDVAQSATSPTSDAKQIWKEQEIKEHYYTLTSCSKAAKEVVTSLPEAWTNIKKKKQKPKINKVKAIANARGRYGATFVRWKTWYDHLPSPPVEHKMVTWSTQTASTTQDVDRQLEPGSRCSRMISEPSMSASRKRPDSWLRMPHEITMINTLQAAQPPESNYRTSKTLQNDPSGIVSGSAEAGKARMLAPLDAFQRQCQITQEHETQTVTIMTLLSLMELMSRN